MKLSILTAVYDRQATIAQTIASVSAQSYQDVEHLIIDGASKDGTMREVNRAKHPKMRVTSEPDQGIYDALNKGIRHATGEVVGLMHSDDFFAHDQVFKKWPWPLPAPVRMQFMEISIMWPQQIPNA